MFEKTKNVTIVVLLFILITGSNVYASGDTQFWTTGGVSTNISKDWNLSVDEEIRFSEEGNIFYHHTNLDLTYSGIADWMDIGICYRQAYSKSSSSGKWSEEHQPQFNVTFKGILFDCGIKNRTRIGFRDLESKDMWRLRNKTTIKFPWKLTKFKIQPYIADELFFDLSDNGFYRNRIYAGLSYKISNNLKSDLFYVWEIDRGRNWDGIQVIGVSVKIIFE